MQGGDGGGVGVLGGNLAVLDHLGEDGLRGHEAALAVGHGDGVHVVQLAQEHPGGLDAGHPGGDVPALVPADEVEGQGGAGVVGLADLAIGDQPQLDQRLEAIADAQHQPVPVFQQVMNRVGELGVTQEGDDELGRAVRLVSAGEAAGENHHLAAADGGGQLVGGLAEHLGVQVAHHHDLRLDARLEAGVSGVVLAVGAREHGDDRPGMGKLLCGHQGGALRAEDIRHVRVLQPGVRLGGVDLL